MRSYSVPVVGLAVAFAVAGCSDHRSQDRSFAKRHFLDIANALHAYHEKNGTLPFSAKGPDHALYELRDLLDASSFDARADKNPEQSASWDDQERCLRNGDYEYLNEAVAELSPELVVAMQKPADGQTYAYLGYIDGIWSAQDFFRQPDRRVLGCWNSPEHEYLIRGGELCESIWRTHYVSGTQGGTSVSNGRLTSFITYGDQLRIDFRYAGTRLSHCTVTTLKGVIEEDFVLDDLGILVRCDRTPKNWRDLLP